MGERETNIFGEHRYRDGEPCSHRGCLSHISHPCEGCGRIAGRYPSAPAPAEAVAWMSTDGRIVVPAHEMAGWVNQYAKDGVPIPLFAHPAPARGEAVREFSEAEVDAARRIVVVFTDERPDDDQSTVTWGDALLLAKAVERLARPDRERGT